MFVKILKQREQNDDSKDNSTELNINETLEKSGFKDQFIELNILELFIYKKN